MSKPFKKVTMPKWEDRIDGFFLSVGDHAISLQFGSSKFRLMGVWLHPMVSSIASSMR